MTTLTDYGTPFYNEILNTEEFALAYTFFLDECEQSSLTREDYSYNEIDVYEKHGIRGTMSKDEITAIVDQMVEDKIANDDELPFRIWKARMDDRFRAKLQAQ